MLNSPLLDSPVLDSRGKSLKDHLWSAMAAFVTHSLAVSALALGLAYSEGGVKSLSRDTFSAEVVFDSKREDRHASPLMVEHRPKTQGIRSNREKGQKKGRVRDSSLLEASLTPVPSEPGWSMPLYNPPPVYPREARRRKVEGVALVSLSVAPDGAVDQATTLPPRTDPLLEEAALKAVRQWKFLPGIRTLEVPIEFKLS